MNSALNEKEPRPADEPLSRLEEQLAKLAQDFVSHTSGPQATPRDTFQPEVAAEPGNQISPGRWAVRGFVGILLAAGIGLAAFTWLGLSGDAAKTAPPQPAPPQQAQAPGQQALVKSPSPQEPAQAAPSQPAPSQPAPSRPTTVAQNVMPAATALADTPPLLQSMARDLSSQGREIEQLKASRDLLARDNANLTAQLQASQEQLTRAVAGLSEQLKASQEQGARDNANVAEQIRGIQEQLARLNATAAEQDARPAIAAAAPRPTLPRPRTT